MKNPAKNMKTITLESGTYDVVRLKLKEVKPLMDSGDFDSMALARMAVRQSGEPIGEAFDEMYFDEAQELLTTVMELNGLGGKDDKGNG